MVCQYFVLEAGKAFVKKKGKLTEKDLKAENNLPTSKVVYKYVGSINNYQKAIDAPITLVNRFITQEDIEAALNDYFMNNERIVKVRKVFFGPISEPLLYYGRVCYYLTLTIEHRHRNFRKI